jgi:hypothetical protein
MCLENVNVDAVSGRPLRGLSPAVSNPLKIIDPTADFKHHKRTTTRLSATATKQILLTRNRSFQPIMNFSLLHFLFCIFFLQVFVTKSASMENNSRQYQQLHEN